MENASRIDSIISAEFPDSQQHPPLNEIAKLGGSYGPFYTVQVHAHCFFCGGRKITLSSGLLREGKKEARSRAQRSNEPQIIDVCS